MILLFSPTRNRHLDLALLKLGEVNVESLLEGKSEEHAAALEVLYMHDTEALIASWKRWYALEQVVFLLDIGLLLLPLLLYKVAFNPTKEEATMVGLLWAAIWFLAYLGRRRFLRAIHTGPRVAFPLLSGNAAIGFVVDRILEERGGHSNWRYWSSYYYTHLTRMLNEVRVNNSALEEGVRRKIVKLRDAIGKRSQVFGEPGELQSQILKDIQFHVGHE